jgi:hypothetical protein
MTLHRDNPRSADQYAAMFKFLDAYANHTYPDDVGGLLGQLSFLREHPPCTRADERELRKAVSIALTAR